MEKNRHGRTAYLLMHHHGRRKQPPCSLLKLPPDHPVFLDTVRGLAREIHWDSDFLLYMLAEFMSGESKLHDAYPSICEALSVRMFGLFLQRRGDESLGAIADELLSDLPPTVTPDDVWSLIRFSGNTSLHEFLRLVNAN